MLDVSYSDLKALVAIVEDGRSDEPTPGVPWAVLDGLRELIPGGGVGFVELDVRTQMLAVGQMVTSDSDRTLDLAAGHADDPDDPFWRFYGGFRGCRADDSGAQVVRWSDHYTRSELETQPMYAEVFRQWDWNVGMTLNLPALPGYTRRLLFWRDGTRDFSDRDALTLQLLAPHLYDVYRDSRRRREDLPRLTRREWQVLDLAGQGLGNTEIARMLSVSVGTVRKHMEHILAATKTHSRSAAVARMLPWSDSHAGLMKPCVVADSTPVSAGRPSLIPAQRTRGAGS